MSPAIARSMAAAPVPASARGRSRHLVALVAALVLGVAALVGVEATSPAAAAAATSGCHPVGGGAVDTGGGPNRATVVVDTGLGTVWSACVSFSGSISGIEALDRAAAQIPDLNPVFDQYSGLGRAVCRLRGVGSDPPDCLGKSMSYWSFSINGRVAPVGGGSVALRDGDVHGWRYGTGGTPRAASAGTEATSAPPPTTTTTRPATPTTQPAPPTTRPPATVPGGSGGSGSTGGLGGSGTGSGVGGSSNGGANGSPGSDAGAGDDTGATTPGDGGSTDADAPADGDGDGSDEAGAQDGDEASSSSSDGAGAGAGATDGAVDGDGGDGDQQAAGAAAGGAGSTGGSGGGSGGSSSMGSAAGFLVALGLVGAGALVVRRRRLAATGPGSVTDPAPA